MEIPNYPIHTLLCQTQPHTDVMHERLSTVVTEPDFGAFYLMPQNAGERAFSFPLNFDIYGLHIKNIWTIHKEY